MDDYFDQRITPQPDDTPETERESPHAEATSASSETEADTDTPDPLKAAVQDLIRYGLVEQTAKPNIYRRLQRDQAQVATILEPLDFEMRFDEPRGLAYLIIAASAAKDSDDAWQHPLVRRQRFTTEQSLLVAILRQIHMAYEQDCGIGAEGAHIDADELRAQLDLYLGTSGSEQRDQTRLVNLLAALQKHGIVSGPDKENQVQIRPVIVHLSNPEQLTLLLQHFQKLAEAHPNGDPASNNPPEKDATNA